jgi:hypothetical protein
MVHLLLIFSLSTEPSGRFFQAIKWDQNNNFSGFEFKFPD